MLLPLPTLEAQSASPSALAPAVAAAKELPRLHSLLVAQRGDHHSRALLQRPPRDDARQRQVGLQERHLRARRHRGRSQAAFARAIRSRSTFPICRSRSERSRSTHLLTMQSGLESTSNRNYGAWVQSPNWVRHALAKPLVAAPGTQMIYSTGNTHILSAILTKATGKSTWQFAQEALAKPLGFSLSPWMRDPQGIYFGGNEMVMTPRQMLAFGEMYRNGGRVERPADSVEDIHRRHLRAARPFAHQRPRVRLRLVDARHGRPQGVLRVGLRRPVHRARARASS